jgi:Kef-type K+ transport system membrane component KefB
MDAHQIVQLLGVLAIVLVAARFLGLAASAIGQPPVLGELLAGVLLGASVVGLIRLDNHDNPQNHVLHFLQELGVIILLFEIGLETDLLGLLRSGASSTAVAIAGVVLPFVGGYFVSHWFGLPIKECVVVGAALTATSVGITARVLNDLGRLHEPESRIVLGAAVIDDILGLIILAVVSEMAEKAPPVHSAAAQNAPEVSLSFAHVAGITAVAFGFLIGVLVLGSLIVPPLARWLARLKAPGMMTTLGVVTALGLAWGAEAAGSASIIGAFAAGLLLGRTPQARDIEKAVVPLGHVFVPIFFVVVGASVDVRTFVPRDPAGWTSLALGGSLIVVAVLGKFAAGYAPFWFKGNKAAIGVGMIPRGEVGLIFAQMGLTAKVFDHALFSSITLMVLVTTFIAPVLLRVLYPPVKTEKGDTHP